jgi:putative transposase
MPFWKCYYHVIWSTKNREPLILPRYECVLFDAVRSKATELQSTLLAVNGMPDHIHIAVMIPPAVAIGQWVGQVKGASSHAVNLYAPDAETKFRWQESYGVLTFGQLNLAMVTAYIERQKEHHARGALEAYLERDAP